MQDAKGIGMYEKVSAAFNARIDISMLNDA